MKTCSFLFLSILLLASCSLFAQSVTKEEALALARKIEVSIAQGDQTVLDHIFDKPSLKKRVQALMGPSTDPKYIDGGIRGFADEGQFGKKLIDGLGPDGSYQLVRQYEKDKTQHLLFRAYTTKSLINYYDYELVKTADGVKAADMYIYLTGEKTSKLLADLLRSANKVDLTKEDLEKLDRLNSINLSLQKQEYEKAEEYYKDIPDALKKDRAFQLIHIRISSGLGLNRYYDAINEYRALFPHDPNIPLLMISMYVQQKDYPKALETVNVLDSALGGDPYQDFERGKLYLLMKDTANALACYERVHQNMPIFQKGIVQLMQVYLLQNQHDKAVRMLKEAIARHYLREDNLQVIYSYRPDLKKELEADSTKQTGN